MGKRILATFLVIGLLGFTGGTAVADVDRRVVQQALDKLTGGGGELGAQALVTDGRDRFTARAGVAELNTTRPVPYDGRFRIGSITKTFASIVVLQLAGAGKVRLDAPVDRYLPGLVDNDITVRQLLQHTSGLNNYNNSVPLDAAGYEQIRYKDWQPEELVELSTSKPLDFPPGTRFSYSNTGFIVAGLLIERVTGMTFERAVQRHILKPLRMNDTVAPGHRLDIPGPHAHGYFAVGTRPVDIARQNPSLWWAAGGMISTTRDLDTFVTAVAKGKLLRKAEQDELIRTSQVSPEYGLGFIVRKMPCGTTVWGHNGLVYGYSTDMYTTPDTSRRLVASYTHSPVRGTGDGHQQLLNAVFC